MKALSAIFILMTFLICALPIEAVQPGEDQTPIINNPTNLTGKWVRNGNKIELLHGFWRRVLATIEGGNFVSGGTIMFDDSKTGWFRRTFITKDKRRAFKLEYFHKGGGELAKRSITAYSNTGSVVWRSSGTVTIESVCISDNGDVLIVPFVSYPEGYNYWSESYRVDADYRVIDGNNGSMILNLGVGEVAMPYLSPNGKYGSIRAQFRGLGWAVKLFSVKSRKMIVISDSDILDNHTISLTDEGYIKITKQGNLVSQERIDP